LIFFIFDFFPGTVAVIGSTRNGLPLRLSRRSEGFSQRSRNWDYRRTQHEGGKQTAERHQALLLQHDLNLLNFEQRQRRFILALLLSRVVHSALCSVTAIQASQLFAAASGEAMLASRVIGARPESTLPFPIGVKIRNKQMIQLHSIKNKVEGRGSKRWLT
jgi:hypothetical protein